MKCNIICNFATPKVIVEMIKDINRDNIRMFEALIEGVSNIAIVTHMKPDGDAIGSSVAMFRYLAGRSRKARIILNDPAPAYLSFLLTEDVRNSINTYNENPKEAIEAINSSSLVICLDFNAFHRTDNLEEALSESKARKILIDHHLNPDREKFDLIFSETEISSASELTYHILMATETVSGDASRLPMGCAEALMTGMTTDTNNFANSVFPSTLHMASDLLAAGVDRDAILSNLYNQYSESRLRLMGHMMRDLMKITDDGVAYIVLDKETQEKYSVAEGDTEGFVNMPLSIARVRMSLLLKEDGNRIRVSIRSKRGTSANMCARLHFNGGGHENAAGGRLNMPADITSIAEAAEYIERHTHEFFRS